MRHDQIDWLRHERRWDRHREWRHYARREEWGDTRYEWPDWRCWPGVFDARPSLLGAAALHWPPYYRHVCELGVRVAEAMLLKPLLWERVAWGNAERWRHRPHWWEQDCHEEHNGPGCEEQCEGCGCDKTECCCEKRRSVDLRIESHAGDVRNKVILVENNSPRQVTVAPEAEAWIDASGTTVASTVTFSPGSHDIAPGEAKEFKATVVVSVPPLEGGVSYFTRIHLKGCSARPISVELHVEPVGRIAVVEVTDPCRPRRGGFVEFREEYCGPPRRCRRDCCESDRCEPRFWGGKGPCRHSYPRGRWQSFWLAPLLGIRCC